MILTDGRGRPLTPPEAPASGAPIEAKIAFLRGYAAYSDAISTAANRAFCRGLRKGLRK